MARIFLTGGLRIEGPAGVLVDRDLPGAQGRLALAALVLERRPLARDKLADVLWGESLPLRWIGALHALVSKLRASLASVGLSDAVTSVGGAYTLALPPDVWIDLEDAMRRLDRAQGALRHGDTGTATAEATVASGILRRPLLAGVGGDWVERQRRQTSTAHHRCCVVLAEAWLERGDHALAVTVAETAIALDPLREVGYRLVMRAELARGDRAAALQAFARCERVMAEALEALPSPETAALAARLRA